MSQRILSIFGGRFWLQNTCDCEIIKSKQGKVKWFNNEKGYGFIEYGDLEDIFVHYSAIIKEGYKTLSEGALVNFKLVETSKGLQAIDVSEAETALV